MIHQPHVMREDQAMLSLRGLLDRPDQVVSLRSGVARYGPKSRQRCYGAETSAQLEESLSGLQNAVHEHLERFSGLNAELRLQGLIRSRQVDHVLDYRQYFEGFWGTIRIDGAWNSVFGSKGEGTVFRRGIWEAWSPDMKRFRDWDTRYPFILSPYCGTLFHEAVGHAMEAEYLATSPLKFHVGERLSHEELTIVDKPDLPGYAGSMTHDDTGAPASETTLIHRGIMVGDLDHGRGVSRRGSYRELPQVRATNFLIKPGSSEPGEWLAQLPRCYYVSGIRSGNWKPGSPKIKVLSEAVFLLEKGRPVAYRPWLVLTFSTLDLLRRVRAIGSDVTMDPVVHWCMKKNQAVPMGMGSPSLLIAGGET